MSEEPRTRSMVELAKESRKFDTNCVSLTSYDSLFARITAHAEDYPLVVAQLGQSLDGRIATISGDSFDINGPSGLDHLHRLRAHVDAVIVGAGTIAADNPRLTVRRVTGKSPARTVIDPRGRLPGGLKWLAEDGVRRIVVTGEPAAVNYPCDKLIRLPAPGGRIAPKDVIAALAEEGFRRILVEGGANTISHFIDAGCIDRLHVIVAPVIIGSGKPGLQLSPVAALADARRPQVGVHLLGGGDVLFDCELKAQGRIDAGDGDERSKA